MTETIYRRPLPEALVPFSAPEGRALFREALADGGLEGYFPVAEQFHTQSDPAFCGPGSLVVALNALGIDPGRLWKGPWRWYSEDLLDCCVAPDEIRARGLALDELACLAGCNGASTRTFRPDGAGLDAWRAAVAAAAGGDGSVVIAAYDRAALGQTGAGHYSPVAGFHRGRDLALVLDVARFKYPPHWVGIERLFEAMRPQDPTTGQSRGWVVLRRGEGSAAVWSLTSARGSWRTILDRVDAGRAPSGVDLAAVIDAIAAMGPVLAVRATGDPRHAALAETLARQLRATSVHAEVAGRVPSPDVADAVAIALLATGLASPGDDAAELGAEVHRVRTQLAALTGRCQPR